MQKASPNHWFINRWLLSAVIAGLILLAYWLHWQSIQNFVVSIDQCNTLFCDFYRHFYPMGQEALANFQPVKGFFYSPFAALLLTWTAYTSSRNALLIWGLVQAAAIAGLYLLPIFHLLNRSRAWQVIYTLVFFTSLPLLHNIKWGQLSVLVTFLVLVALVLYEKGNHFWSAVFLALAIAIKYYPAIFLVYFLIRRDLRYLVACGLISAIFLLVVPGAVLGVNQTLQFYRLTGAASAQAANTWMKQDLNTQYIGQVARRLFALDENATAQAGWRLLGWLVSAMNIALLWNAARVRQQRLTYWTWSLLFSTLPFWLLTSWPHYFVYLPLAQVFLLSEIQDSRLTRWDKALLGTLCVISILCSNTITFILVGRWQAYSSRGFLFFANLILVFILLALLNRRSLARIRGS